MYIMIVILNIALFLLINFQFKTIKAGTVAGRKGRALKDKTKKIAKKPIPSKMNSSDKPGTDIDAIKGKAPRL